MFKKILVSLGIAVLSAVLAVFPAFAASAEQVQVKMPNIDLYFYADGDDLSAVRPADVTASLGDRALKAESLTRDSQGIFYVYLLDVSASIPDGHFNAAREAVKLAASRLRSQDKLALISFGNEVSLLLKGGESAETVSAALDGLTNRDQNTKFYTAMDTLIQTLGSAADMRRVAVVVSDGIDDTDAGISQQELESTLLRSGISVSALCIDTASAESIAQFRTLLQISGGELYPFSAETASATLDSLLSRLSDGYFLKLTAPNNLIGDGAQMLSVDFGQGTKLSLDVTPAEWVPDNTPPAVVSAALSQKDGTVTVKYTEPVLGAELPASYVLTAAGQEPIPVKTAAAVDETTYTVTPESAIPAGSAVTLTIRGVTDLSMEKNELTAFSQVLREAAATTVATTAPAAEEPESGFPIGAVAIPAGVLIAAAIAVFVILRLTRTGKREKTPKQPREKKEKTDSKATFVFLKDEDQTGKKS